MRRLPAATLREALTLIGCGIDDVARNEGAVIKDIRTFISAQAAYYDHSGRYACPVTCLGAPSAPGCIGGYSAAQPLFLDPQSAVEWWVSPVDEYVRSFRCDGRTGDWLYWLVPNDRKGRRFCTDKTGEIRFTPDNRERSYEEQETEADELRCDRTLAVLR